jgi:predicted patatin/cPLA2 family phospholipase
MTRHPVIDLIAARSVSGSKPHQRADTCKLGLVIEGGAMRGVVSAGMVTALEYLGFLDVFDAVYGCSAGAVNGAYFLARQASYGTTIYYEEINNRHFINVPRTVLGRPLISLDYLLNQVVASVKILDWKAVLDSPIPLKILVSSVTERRALLLADFQSRDELFSALRASARVPLLAGSPVTLRNHTLLDGSIYEAIPYRSALADGCSHLLVLLTRPPGATASVKWRFLAGMITRYLATIDELLCEAFRQRSALYQSDLAILAKAAHGAETAPYILPVSTSSQSALVGQLEKRRSNLVAGAMAGMRAVIEALVAQEPDLVEVIAPFSKSGRRIGEGCVYKIDMRES